MYFLACLLNFCFSCLPLSLNFFFPDSQVETDIVTKINETEEGGKSDGDDDDTHESWEEEVEGLVAWTNTLDTDTLDD